jgi:hypothetical protein
VIKSEFLPASKRGPRVGFIVRALQAMLVAQTVFDVSWYDMLTVVSAPAGVAA